MHNQSAIQWFSIEHAKYNTMCRFVENLRAKLPMYYRALVATLLFSASSGLYDHVSEGEDQPQISRSLVSSGWKMQSSNHIEHKSQNLLNGDNQREVGGSTISSQGFDTSRWYSINNFPTTVLAGLQESEEYPDLYYSDNLQIVNPSRFDVSWWYRTEVQIPVLVSTKSTATLLFKGINYRANVWINGRKVADNTTMIGSFRQFSIDVHDALHISGRNGESVRTFVLAVETFRPYDYGLVLEDIIFTFVLYSCIAMFALLNDLIDSKSL